jgi:hypothetical protein
MSYLSRGQKLSRAAPGLEQRRCQTITVPAQYLSTKATTHELGCATRANPIVYWAMNSCWDHCLNGDVWENIVGHEPGRSIANHGLSPINYRSAAKSKWESRSGEIPPPTKSEAAKIGRRLATATAKNGPAPGTALTLIPVFVLALTLFALRLVTALHDPFFEGDPGQRMHMAYLPVAGVGNRIWLPLLQIHIWVFYLLHLPYYTFKIIPCFYFLIALLFLGLLTYRQTAKTPANLAFTLLLMLCFAFQLEVQFVSTRLYQESLALAGLYVLLWAGAIELRDNKWLLPIGVAALVTRECFWIYLLAICLLNWKRILSHKVFRSLFAFLWSIPVFWLFATLWVHLHQRREHPSAVEWPLGINKQGDLAVSHVAASLASFTQSLVTSRAIFLVVALIIVWTIGRVLRETGAPSTNPDLFDSRFRPFSMLSLGIIYTLIILFNPWEATFANERMVVPLVAQAFIWAGLLYSDTSHYTTRLKVLSRIVLIAGMVLSMNLDVRTWISHDDPVEEHTVADIAQLVAASGGSRPANVCILKEDYWEALERFAGPTLYAHLILDPKKQLTSGVCDLVFLKSGFTFASNDEFQKYRDYQLLGRSYVAYRSIGAASGSGK